MELWSGRLWSGYGVRLGCPVMFQLWSGYGPVIVQLWSSYVPAMVQLLSGYGPVILSLALAPLQALAHPSNTS